MRIGKNRKQEITLRNSNVFTNVKTSKEGLDDKV